MVDREKVLEKVRETIAEASELSPSDISEETVLIGPDSSLSSRELVEVLLELEEYAEDALGVEFDWTSDSALSIGRSILRTVGTLVDHLHGLTTENK